jgi:hypothetical protein
MEAVFARFQRSEIEDSGDFGDGYPGGKKRIALLRKLLPG